MSVIGNEFSGLPIEDLIGGPLKAACDAQVRLATATANFINTVGFYPEIIAGVPSGKLLPRQVDFSFWQPIPMKKEVLATGTITLSGAIAGNVTNIKIGGVEILGATVQVPTPSPSSLDTVAKAIADQINVFQQTGGKFTATSNGVTITIQAPQGSGATLNGKTIDITPSSPNPPGTTQFSYSIENLNGGVDGETEAKVQKVVLSVPFLAITNVPALMIKNVDITFDMEVKSSESHKDEQSQDFSLDAGIKINYGIISADIKIHASVSAHQENTRSTDRSAKYHVAVSARDDGMPEGLSRVLDILQKSIAPVSTSKPQTLDQANIAQQTKS